MGWIGGRTSITSFRFDVRALHLSQLEAHRVLARLQNSTTLVSKLVADAMGHVLPR